MSKLFSLLLSSEFVNQWTETVSKFSQFSVDRAQLEHRQQNPHASVAYLGIGHLICHLENAKGCTWQDKQGNFTDQTGFYETGFIMGVRETLQAR